MKSKINSVKSMLTRGKSSGMTAKQISLSLEIDNLDVDRILKELHSNDEVSCTGRGLWILKQYEDISHDEYFIGPEFYFDKIKLLSKKLKITNFVEPITFRLNHQKHFHSWSPYVQGFSSEFVDYVIDKYSLNEKSYLFDPFSGSGTVSVQSKLRGVNSIGIEMMPLMSFMSNVKINWDFSLIDDLKKNLAKTTFIPKSKSAQSLPFLRATTSHFSKPILQNLLKIKQFVVELQENNDPTTDFFRLAFGSILIPCSRLKRSPSLGYPKKEKILDSNIPFKYFNQKISQIISDLEWARDNHYTTPESKIINGDSRKISKLDTKIDMALTSPPYINGMDYVTNYKIETVWLDFAKTYAELKDLKNSMVVCDNVSTNLYKNYTPKYYDPWIEEITNLLENRINEKGNYRRNDMHKLVLKYFDDLYLVLKNTYENLKDNGKFHIVIGDSLMAGIYIPADILVGKMGLSLGYKLEDIKIARQRRSGQRHDFQLRESIVILKK